MGENDEIRIPYDPAFMKAVGRAWMPRLAVEKIKAEVAEIARGDDTRADYARIVLDWADGLQKARQAGDLDRATSLALMLGTLLERIGVMPFEKYIEKGVETTKKLQAGHAAIERPPEQIAAAIAEYRWQLRNRRTKKGAAERETHKKTGVPPRTLRYHLKKAKSGR